MLRKHSGGMFFLLFLGTAPQWGIMSCTVAPATEVPAEQSKTGATLCPPRETICPMNYAPAKCTILQGNIIIIAQEGSNACVAKYEALKNYCASAARTTDSIPTISCEDSSTP